MSALYDLGGGFPPTSNVWRRVGERVRPVIVTTDLRECAGFVYYRDRHGSAQVVGTAFLAQDPAELLPGRNWAYFVTARHVVEDARRKASDDQLLIRLNDRGGGVLWYEVPFTDWGFHPSDSPQVGADWWDRSTDIRYDVAVCSAPNDLLAKLSIAGWNISDGSVVTDQLISDEGIQPGDDVVITGLYLGHPGDDRNVPIIRSGIIAAMPHRPIATGLGPMDGFLIESRSTGGLSGSPVFWLSGTQRIDPATNSLRILPQYMVRLLGIIHGHFNVEATSYAGGRENMNEGISIVAPVRQILETIRQEEHMTKRRAVEQEVLATESSPAGAVMDSVASDDERLSLAPVEPADALRALLRTPPHGQTQDPA